MFKSASRFLGFTASNKDASDYAKLVKRILEDKVELCARELSSPLFAWTNFLNKYEGSKELTKGLRRIITASMVTPMGNSAVERSFRHVAVCLYSAVCLHSIFIYILCCVYVNLLTY